ncbi:MAG: class I SAM-dependent methyltransferase [Methylocystis sp.]
MSWFKKQLMHPAAPATEEFIYIIYQSLFQRAPSGDEINNNLKRNISDIIHDLRKTPDFANNFPNLIRQYTIRLGTQHVDDTNNFKRMLEKSPISEGNCHSMIMSSFLPGDYYEFHKLRFQELHGLVAYIDEKRSVNRLLEISTMPYTTGVWKKYLKQLNCLTTIDLQAEKGGPSPEQVASFGADKHVEVDLNTADLGELAANLAQGGGFDIIIATEVVEHLQRDFSEIAQFMFNCLAPSGVIIVTTPNAVCEVSLLCIVNGRNPFQRFVDYNGNKGGHMHFREYSMAELLDDVAKIGAVPFMQIYSACWRDDAERCASEDRYHLRANNVVLFGHSQDLPLWRPVP